MNVIQAIRGYVNKIISIKGMKALLLDQETTSIISLVYAQSEIIAEEVFLVERIDAQKKGNDKNDVSMHHLKAVVFVQPTARSVAAIKAHLRKPKYNEYHLFFSNILKEELLQDLASADEFEVIKQVQEYFGDYYAVNPSLFHLNLPACQCLSRTEAPNWGTRERRLFRRNVDGILSVLLSLKKRPVVRYQRSSELAKRVAFEATRRMKEEAQLFHFSSEDPLLLVLDRREDPITPLLLQWTYQAMVHELLTIKNNRVDLSKVPNVKKDMREVVLSTHQDRFFRGSKQLNYGDLGASIKDLVEKYQRKVKSNQKIATIEDMQRFVENYPEFRSMSGNVSKHVTLMTELSRLVENRNLMDVSEVEQELACQADHTAALEALLNMLENPRLSDDDRLRLVLLYALRYEQNSGQVSELKAILRSKAVTDRGRRRVAAVDLLLQYAGMNVRGGDLFGNKKLASKIASFFGAGLKGVENIYTQHKPYLVNILEPLVKGKLKTPDFPFVDGDDSKTSRDVIVFMVGGCTYEEAVAVDMLNESKDNPGYRFLLGGSCVHNSTSFIDDILGKATDDEEEKSNF